MIELKDYFDFFIDIYNWFNNLPSTVLSFIIVALIAGMVFFYKRHTTIVGQYEQIHLTISSEMFNIKQGRYNTANLTVYPIKSTSNLPSYQLKYKCNLVINPYNQFGDNFAIRVRSKSPFSILDSNQIVITSNQIGGFITAHLGEVYFINSMTNFYSTAFEIHTNTDLFELEIEIISENVTGNYKFILVT